MATEAVSSRPRRSFQQELVPTRENRSQRSRGKPEESESSGETRRSRRRGKKGDETQASPPTATPPAAAPPPVSTQPVTEPVNPGPPTEARSLAERYVAQYETQSGNTLSSEARSAKIQEVEKFYQTQSRQERLDKIVFA